MARPRSGWVTVGHIHPSDPPSPACLTFESCLGIGGLVRPARSEVTGVGRHTGRLEGHVSDVPERPQRQGRVPPAVNS